jgi:chaperone required for assembly of F1-ATPase
MKRFYKQVSVTPELGILLDSRPVKTPAKATLTLLNVALAEAVAAEWRAQGTDINPFSMPFTGLANAAIDRVGADPLDFAAGIATYAETELICYRASDPSELVARQATLWDPIMLWASHRYGVTFTCVTGIMHQQQPPQTLVRLSQAVAERDPWELAPLSPLVTISGSLLIPLAMLDDAMPAEAAFDAAHLDELWQAEKWGEDDFALEARAARRKDFLAAAQFLDLVRN